MHIYMYDCNMCGFFPLSISSSSSLRSELYGQSIVCFLRRVAVFFQNKAERKITREQALLKKNPVVIKEELDKLEEMGGDAGTGAVQLPHQRQLLRVQLLPM